MADGTLEIKDRLCIRGFQDLQQNSLKTYSGTASKQGQRSINFLAANRKDFVLFSCDVGAAFLKGLTFKKVRQLTGEPLRSVQLDSPPGTIRLMRTIEDFKNYDPVIHCMEMVRPGFGLKDAPRLWNMRVKKLMVKLNMASMVSDAHLFCRWLDSKKKSVTKSLASKTPERATPALSGSSVVDTSTAKFQSDEVALQGLQLAVSTHVDDFKGAATEKVADAFMDVLEAEFGKLTRQKRACEHCGIIHEQVDGEVRCSQDHYVKQLRLILLNHAGDLEDDVPEDVKQSFWSLLGGAAWLVSTRGEIVVYIGHLQRRQQSPKWKHIRHLNALARWMRRKPSSLLCANEFRHRGRLQCFLILLSGHKNQIVLR